MCAEFAKDSTEFFDKWTKINREWRSVFFANGHPTEEAAFAAKYGHPRLRDFVRATSDDAPLTGLTLVRTSTMGRMVPFVEVVV